MSLLYIHHIHLLHIHAMGVPEDVTLLEFDGTSQKAPKVQQPKPEAQDVQLTRRSGGWVPGSQAVQLCERQAPEHYKPPNFWNIIKYYVISIVALSDRCWMKTLVALISNPCPDTTIWILSSSESSRMLSPTLSGRSRVISCHLRAIRIYMWQGWLYLLSEKGTWLNLNKDRTKACRFAMTPSVSIKIRFLEPFLFMLNACLSLSWPGPSAWPWIQVAQLGRGSGKYKVRLKREPYVWVQGQVI
jgi:hypothetical protein